MTASAEWKFDFDGYINKFYIDYSRITNEGQYKSILSLRDLESPDTDDSSGKQFKSAVTKYFIDCKSSRWSPVAVYKYSEQMGKGKLIASETYSLGELRWFNSPIEFGERLIKVACPNTAYDKEIVRNCKIRWLGTNFWGMQCDVVTDNLIIKSASYNGGRCQVTGLSTRAYNYGESFQIDNSNNCRGKMLDFIIDTNQGSFSQQINY
jgi:hypothetical protein